MIEFIFLLHKKTETKKKIKMVFTRDYLNPIMNTVPYKTRPNGYFGALPMAAIAAINPKSYFISPFFGVICWIILTWWAYNRNPLGLVRPSGPSLITGNPTWYQTLKSLIIGFVLTPFPIFVLYLVLLVIARATANVK